MHPCSYYQSTGNSLYVLSLHYISVEQRILNQSSEIQTEELLLPRLIQKG